jgi:phosphohistidine phosphatase
MSQKQIMLLRHAKAETGTLGGDFNRKLTSSGIEHATSLGIKLLELRLLPQLIYCSTAKRAAQTCDLVCEQLAIDTDTVQFDDRLYMADVGTFLSQLHRINNRFNRVMLVAHNPSLEDLVDYLATAVFDSDQPSGKRMLPATLVMLEFDGDWADLHAHSCRLALRLHGKLLEQ